MRWLWRSVVGKLWITIMLLVAVVLIILGMFLLQYIDIAFEDSFRVKVLFVYIGIIGFLLSTFFAFFLSSKITQPLLQLKDAADLISQGEYRTRVPIRSSDEIGELAGTFNRMASELHELITDLNHEKEHLSSVLRSMADAVITLDAGGNVVLANPPGELLLERWRRVDWNQDEDPEGLPLESAPRPLRDLFRTVSIEGRDLSQKLQVQSGVWSVVMAPLKSEDTVRGVVAVMRDVTEEHRLEKLRRDFVANVSHEIRTPLSMLQGYSEALLDDIAGSPEERRELVQVIHDESLRMGRLVKDLLDLARMEAGHVELNFNSVDLDGLVSRVVHKFQVYSMDRDIKIEYRSPEEAVILAEADEDRLEQVLTNLLDNAVRHSSDGSAIRLTLGRTNDAGGTAAVLKVADEGQGIPADDLPYIFERFYKADKARKRGAGGGTGLGLAIVRNIVDAHGGTIRAESTEGVGTSFTLLLPVEGHRVMS
ncbi:MULTISPECIES: ATP-binding protein [unclassified Paenibacillus]|uniref:sensor histidine kinase n=1 Tax=unclassified Paenibacillus TaxID=185978 RepID=UPI000953D158|nr:MULTISPECIES: ATP-binding protein [unclassified Paenibacillus]ASS65091.1 cell wall metabolism sensor histidine kinase WalK [Paenibacillus sp. RUD330]SIQ48808.1 two-component system, OmpR family, sensor histidine kinase ResE [Paenibacillus sp. RU4X]SIQ70736.1 two-component system, OmpR family, sensor histidine kinase ResE [Paenibacillus sp. RU4T]